MQAFDPPADFERGWPNDVQRRYVCNGKCEAAGNSPSRHGGMEC